MDTIFLLVAAQITLIALDLGEAGARTTRPSRGRRQAARDCPIASAGSR